MADTWFKVHRSALLPAWQHAARPVEAKASVPILTHVLFVAEGDRLRVRGTSFDLEIEAECELMEQGSVSFAVPEKRFGDILKQLPESAEITFCKGRGAGHVGIETGSSRFSLPYLPASDFPTMRGRDDFQWTDIQGAALADAIGRVSYAVSRNQTDRSWIIGMCLRLDKSGSGIEICGTDGLTLASVELPGAGAPILPQPNRDTFAQIILPVRTTESFVKLLDGATDGAQLAANENLVALRYDDVQIVSKLIDGIYPAYERIVPERNDQTIVVSREVLVAAARRVCAVVGNQERDGIRLKVVGGKLQLDLLSEEGGFSRDLVSCECNVPDGFTIAHGASRFEKTLSMMRSADLELSLVSETKAIVIRPLGGKPELHMVQPMRPKYVAE